MINGVNDLGQLVGFYADANDNVIGFVATPVPEPGSLMLLGSGMLAGMGFLRRKLRAVTPCLLSVTEVFVPHSSGPSSGVFSLAGFDP